MSSEPWNEFNLTQPPVITIPVKSSSLDLETLRKIFERSVVYYENQKDLEESAAFLSRLIARRKNSFRSLDGYRELCKVNSALCRLLRLDIVNVLKTVWGNLPDFIRSKNFETQLPSLENYDYMLLRIIALQKLFDRISNCCLKSASYFMKLVQKNFFVDILTVFLSTVARIWTTSVDNAKQTAAYYNELVTFRKHFPTRRGPLCAEFSFPERLECAGKDPCHEVIKHQLKTYIKKGVSSSTSSDPSQNNPTIRISMAKCTDSINPQSAVKSFSFASTSTTDIGVAISRDSLNDPLSNIKELKTLTSIRKFIEDEDLKRRKSMADCVTKDVSDKTWKVLRKKIFELQLRNNRSAVKLIRKML